MDPVTIIAIGSTVYGAASEIIGLLPVKQNSVVQMIMSVLGAIFKVLKK